MRVYRCVLGQGTGSFLGNLLEYQFLRVKEYSFGVSLQFIRAYIIFQNNLHEEELEENRLIMRNYYYVELCQRDSIKLCLLGYLIIYGS